MVLPRDLPVEEPPPQRRLRTALRRFRDNKDFIITAFRYYYRIPPLSNRQTAKLFGMPRQTIDDIIRRTPRTHPEVKAAAVRFELLGPVSLVGMPELDLLEIEGLLERGSAPGLPELREQVDIERMPWAG